MYRFYNQKTNEIQNQVWVLYFVPYIFTIPSNLFKKDANS
jgi:hypothetical protein